MTPDSTELLKRNAEYKITHERRPLIKEIQASDRGLPKVCIVTCVDPRVMPEQILGLDVVDAFIFRTIAGHPQSVAQAIAILDAQFGSNTLQEVMIIYHTDCGSQYFDVPRIRTTLTERDPSAATDLEGMTFGAVQEQYGFASLDDSLRHDVEWLKKQPLLRKEIQVKGYIFDLESGKIAEVGGN